MYWLTGRGEKFRVRMWTFFFFPRWRSVRASPVPALAGPACRAGLLIATQVSFLPMALGFILNGITLNQLAHRPQIAPATPSEGLAGSWLTHPSTPPGPCWPQGDITLELASPHGWLLSVLPSSRDWILWMPPAHSACAQCTAPVHLPTSLLTVPQRTLAMPAPGPCTHLCSSSSLLQLRAPGKVKNRDAQVLLSVSDIMCLEGSPGSNLVSKVPRSV